MKEKNNFNLKNFLNNIFIEEVIEEVEETDSEIKRVDYSKPRRVNEPKTELKIIKSEQNDAANNDRLVKIGAEFKETKPLVTPKAVNKVSETKEVKETRKSKIYEPSSVISPIFGKEDKETKKSNDQKKPNIYKTVSQTGVISPYFGLVIDESKPKPEIQTSTEEVEVHHNVKEITFLSDEELTLEDTKEFGHNIELDTTTNSTIDDSELVEIVSLPKNDEHIDNVDFDYDVDSIILDEFSYDDSNETNFFNEVLDDYQTKVVTNQEIPLFDEND